MADEKKDEWWFTPFPSKDDPKVEDAVQKVAKEVAFAANLQLAQEHLEKGMQAMLFGCLALKVLTKDVTPRMGVIMNKIYDTLKEGSADLAIVRWLFTGKEVDKGTVEKLVVSKLEELIAENRKGT